MNTIATACAADDATTKTSANARLIRQATCITAADFCKLHTKRFFGARTGFPITIITDTRWGPHLVCHRRYEEPEKSKLAEDLVIARAIH